MACTGLKIDMHQDRLLIINAALDRMCNEVMIFSYFLGGTEEKHRNLSQDSPSYCRKSDYWRLTKQSRTMAKPEIFNINLC